MFFLWFVKMREHNPKLFSLKVEKRALSSSNILNSVSLCAVYSLTNVLTGHAFVAHTWGGKLEQDTNQNLLEK